MSKNIPRKKCSRRIYASPFRLYKAQISDGIFLGMIIGGSSSVWSMDLDVTNKLPLAENRMPWVMQKLGNMQQAHRKASPIGIVFGMYYKTKTTMTRSPPDMK